MIDFEPVPGLVIRYDFLWKNEHAVGREHGAKDRPCALVLVAETYPDGSRTVVLCPISHTPPDDPGSAVEIPPKVARHLNLDDQQCWIRTHEVNTLVWDRGSIPAGVSRAEKDRWAFGELPYKLAKEVFEQVSQRSRDKTLRQVKRDKDRT